MIRAFIAGLLWPVFYFELPGWGRVYHTVVGGGDKDSLWVNASPRLIRDKRYGMWRIVVISEWADRHLYYLKRWYNLSSQLIVDSLIQKGDVVLDAGANYGHFSLAAICACGPDGSVHAYEPNPSAFARLSMHRQLNKADNLIIHQAGVSDASDELVLKVPRATSGEATFGNSNYTDVTTHRCPVKTIDNEAPNNVDFIKIDVEGFETRTIRGAETTIRRDRPVLLVETMRECLAQADSNPEELFETIQLLGYSAYVINLRGLGLKKHLHLEPTNTPPSDGDLLWFPSESKDELLRRATGSI